MATEEMLAPVVGTRTGTPAFRLTGVCKSFGAVQALRDVDLTLHAGEVLVLVGPNGAGKTTLTRVVSTLERPDRGAIEIFGQDPWQDLRAVRRRLSVVPQSVVPDPMLTAREHVYLYLRARGFDRSSARERADAVFESFDLAATQHVPVSRLSGGFQRRVVLAMAVAAGGDLVLLDEPTGALDPLMKRKTWNLITELCARSAVLLTTHDMAEAEAVGSRVAIMDLGRMLAETTVASLRGMLPSSDKVVVDAPLAALSGLRLHQLGRLQAVGGKTVLYPDGAGASRDAAGRLIGHDLPFAVQPTTLEDVYVHLLGEPLPPV